MGRGGASFMSIGDVSGVPETTGASQTEDAQATANTTSSTVVGGTIGALPQPLVDAICSSIAYNICSSANDSNQRLHDILADAEKDDN